MMDSSTAMGCIRILEGEPSTNVKKHLLEEFMEDEFFVAILKLAYDPLHTFGIRAIEYTPNTTSGDSWDSEIDIWEVWPLLHNLEKRLTSGKAAYEELQKALEGLSVDSAELLYRIIQRDLECGINATTINNVQKGTIHKPGYMRCHLPEQKYLDRFDWPSGIYCQLKADGMFVNISVAEGGYTMYTRKGHLLPTPICPRLDMGLNVLTPGFTYHGELLVKKPAAPLNLLREINRGVKVSENSVVISTDEFIVGVHTLPRKEGNGIINHLVKGDGALPEDHWITVDLWDMVATDEDDTTSYGDRFEALDELLWPASRRSQNAVQAIETHMVVSYEEAEAHYKNWKSQGLEGAVIKNPKGLWKNHTSPDQLKVKPTQRCELRAIEMLPGTGKNEDTFGSILCISEDMELTAQVGMFTDEMRQSIFDSWLSVYQDSILTVKFTETIQDSKGEWSLSNPRFDEWRIHEKDTADTLEYIKKL